MFPEEGWSNETYVLLPCGARVILITPHGTEYGGTFADFW